MRSDSDCGSRERYKNKRATKGVLLISNLVDVTNITDELHFQSLEIIGDIMDQYTEAVLSLFVKFSRERQKKSSSLDFTYLEKKIKKIWKTEKLREKNVEIMGGGKALR